MRIWAHRGCSQRYPENTILSFEKAAAIKGLTGIELDIQLTKDGHMVVIHDERVDRTTDGIGDVGGFTLAELKKLRIPAGNGRTECIPTIEEVLELLTPNFRDGFQLNIELKNNNYPYEGMEEKIVSLAAEKGLQRNIVYSSFSALSLEKLRRLDPEAQIGILDWKVSDCLFKARGGCGADALHPFWRAMDLPAERLRGYTVRAWLTGHLYPETPTGNRLDLAALEETGITDVFLNEPEMYCGER
ncbi:MAG TPA: hypothetical protein DCZ91_05220 [Lachnospiraceae bacterium]|nr:hypothetical protein [Lachnospiraceae bacterium]